MFSVTPSSNELEKENKTKNAASSIFHLSPLKDTINLNEATDQKKGSPDQKKGNKSDVRDQLEFCRRFNQKSRLARKVSEILDRRAESAQNAQHHHSIESLLLPCLPPQKGQSLGGGRHLSRLEYAIIAKKHALSRRFQTDKVAYNNFGVPQKPLTLSGDSLTFEFFNTIAPFLPGSAFADVFVFLCGVNAREQKIHFWEHILTFVSPVNQRTRQNKIQEIWVPNLADFCDELLLVVEGRVMEENSPSQLGLGKRKSMQTPMELKIRRGSEKGIVRRQKPNGMEEKFQLGKRIAKNEEESVKKRKIEGHPRQKDGENTTDSKQAKKSPTKDPIGPAQKPKPVLMFRGFKTIGKWTKEVAEDGKDSEETMFQPLFTSNGMILNVIDIDESNLLSESANGPSYALIKELGRRTKNAAKGTCHMLQMEISNEHGYGTPNFKANSSGQKRKGPWQKTDGKRQKICYIFANQSRASLVEPASLDSLKSLPAAKRSLPCLVCSRRFRHVWRLAFHLNTVHPSLHFQFLLLPANKNDDDRIRIEVSIGDTTIQKCRENFSLGGSGMAFLRKRLYSGQSIDIELIKKELEREGDHEDITDEGIIKANTGKLFNGVLPFNEPNYTESCMSPFANLHGVSCDRGWIRDLYGQRLNQFTDVSEKEKQFFSLWNIFIGSHTVNQTLRASSRIPELLIRFVDSFMEQLAHQKLLSNLVHHCALLEKHEYITRREMFNLLMYAEEKTSKWRKY